MASLPDIDIAIKDDAISFVRKMMDLAENYEKEVHEDVSLSSTSMTVANFRLKEDAEHEGLGFQLIIQQSSPNRVIVEVRASKWNTIEPSLTSHNYVSATKSTVGKLLSDFNRNTGTRYRLRIRKPQYGPKPTRKTLCLLDKFCVIANKSVLHPLDWRRFYYFIKEGRQQFSEEVITQLLCDRGFSSEYAEEIAAVYGHLLEYKAVSK